MLTPREPEFNESEHTTLGRISHSVVEQRGRDVLAALPRYGVTPSPGNRLERAVKVLESIPRDESFPKFIADPANRAATSDAMAGIFQAVAVIEALQQSPRKFQQHSQHGKPLFSRSRLKQLVRGSFPDSFGSGDLPENRRFETYIGALLALSGCSVVEDEPDWRIGYLHGETIGVPVKRINSVNPSAVRDIVKDAARQLKGQNLRGFVVVGVDQLTATLPTTVPAAEYFGRFNQQVRALHDQLDSMDSATHLLGSLLVGSHFQWLPTEDGRRFSLYVAHVHQLLSFSDVEHPERLDLFFNRSLKPRMRNAVQVVCDLSSPSWLKAG